MNYVVENEGRKIGKLEKIQRYIYIHGGRVRGGKREDDWRMGRKHVEERTRGRI